MALDTIIIDGDTVQFNPTYGLAIVAVKPGKITASGKTKINQKKVCVQGDEKSVVVANCSYTTPSFPVPGLGSLKIASLMTNQTSRKSKSGKKAILKKGSVFTARFEVTSPAKLINPTGTLLDAAPFYMGTGTLIASITKIKAT